MGATQTLLYCNNSINILFLKTLFKTLLLHNFPWPIFVVKKGTISERMKEKVIKRELGEVE